MTYGGGGAQGPCLLRGEETEVSSMCRHIKSPLSM